MLVSTEGLTKRYGRVAALDDCTLGVTRGETYGLLGPNGAGKTTLLRLLMGLLRPTSGRATIEGLDTYRQAVQVHRRLAYLPGDVRLFRRMRGRQLLDFFVHVRGQRDRRPALAVAETLQLDVSRRVATMSTGMRQKLALAATLSADVPLLVLDEPTSNLDPTMRGKVMGLVRQARSQGRTVILSSHVLSEVEQTCDRVAILRGGRLVTEQAVPQLRRQHRIRAKLTGDLPALPPSVRDHVLTTSNDKGRLMIDTKAGLAPILGWLATLPVAEITIEPIGLSRVYEQYHGGGPQDHGG